MKGSFLFVLVWAVYLMQCATGQSSKPRVQNERLSPCPKSPNCVSSLSKEESHYVEPLTYEGPLSRGREKLIAVINSMKRSEIVTVEPDYIHATFTSAIFRFVDDVEFLFDDERKSIDLRSASRAGYTDFGVNRKRVEEIRSKFSST